MTLDRLLADLEAARDHLGADARNVEVVVSGPRDDFQVRRVDGRGLQIAIEVR